MGNDKPWSSRVADSLLHRTPNLDERWGYENGVVLRGVEHVWKKTADARYWQYIQGNMDRFVLPDGTIRTYCLEEYNQDLITQGRLLLPLYAATGEDKYRRAAYLLRSQLRAQPRTSEGGFWHKGIYPYQMWLDSSYVGSTFYAEFAAAFDEPEAFDDVVRQIVLIEQHTRDARTGLLHHAWDESKSQRWADPRTGCSRHFWGRGIGWYAMALVDILDVLPCSHPQRSLIITILQRTMEAVVKVRDKASGVWYQILDQGERPGNYLESSASCMFVYALAKGARLGYLDAAWRDVADDAYAAVLREFIVVDEAGAVSLTATCGGAGLGGNPYRDGSFEYYVGERIVTNDRKGVGPFLMASVEMER
jgi:unsaturated rhamnogalacturonyl hydrolase